MIAYTLVPIAVMVLYGFNQAPSGRLTLRLAGLHARVVPRAVRHPGPHQRALHSLEIAALSTLIAVAIGTPAALALARYRFRGRGARRARHPGRRRRASVVVGASLLGLFVYLGVPRGFGTILLAHVAFNVAFVVVVLRPGSATSTSRWARRRATSARARGSRSGRSRSR